MFCIALPILFYNDPKNVHSGPIRCFCKLGDFLNLQKTRRLQKGIRVFKLKSSVWACAETITAFYVPPNPEVMWLSQREEGRQEEGERSRGQRNKLEMTDAAREE